jgi:hypothetical protein
MEDKMRHHQVDRFLAIILDQIQNLQVKDYLVLLVLPQLELLEEASLGVINP